MSTLLTVLGVLAAAPSAADPAPTFTALVERTATTSIYRDAGTVRAGIETFADAAHTQAVTFTSQLGSDLSTSVGIEVAAGLAPGTYTTSRTLGPSSTYLEAGPILSCGTDEPGTLTVRSAQYAPDGTPTEYDASFDASCDGGAPVHGEIRYASDHALALATAPAVSAVPGKVAVGTTADDDVVITAAGNAPTSLGAVTLADVGHDTTGQPYFTVASDGCSNTVLAPGSTCTVTLHVAPIRPNGYPSSTQYATVVVPDGQPDPLRALAQATITPMPGQPVFPVATAQFRQIVLRWLPPEASPADWTVGQQFLYYDIVRVDGGARTLVGTVKEFSWSGASYAVAALPDHYSGTFVVAAHQLGGTDGPDSLPVSASDVASEVLIPEADGVIARPLDPSGADTAFSTSSAQFDNQTGGFTVSRNQVRFAYTFTYPNEAASRVGTGRIDGSGRGDFVSGYPKQTGFSDRQPALSSDGARVVYVHAAGGTTSLQVAGVDPLTPARSVPNSTGLYDPVFGRDGVSIVADRGVGADSALVSVNPTTGAQTVIRGGDGLTQPDVAADGRIVAVQGLQLVVVSPTGTVAPVSGATEGWNARPRFSADGETVYYTHSDDVEATGGHSASVDLASGVVTLYTNGSETSGTPFVLHEDAPDVTAPSVKLTAPTSTSDLATTVSVSWSATDPAVVGRTTAGLDTVDLRYRTATNGGAFGGYTYPAAWTGTTAYTQHLAARHGTEYCFSARARDGAGNVSAWTSDRCTSTPLDDRSLTTKAKRLTGTAYYAGTVSRSTAAKTTFTRSRVTASAVGLVVATCRTCGSIDVYLGSHKLGRVSTKSSATHTKRVVWLPRHLYSGTLTLRSVDRSQVLLDGVLLLR